MGSGAAENVYTDDLRRYRLVPQRKLVGVDLVAQRGLVPVDTLRIVLGRTDSNPPRGWLKMENSGSNFRKTESYPKRPR